MLNENVLESSLEDAYRYVCDAELYVKVLEDILTWLNLYPNKNDYIDYALEYDIKDTLYKLARGIYDFNE